jgi:uncharacterized protein
MRSLAIFGQAGAGKTSLCNRLFGLEWKTDPAVDCTQYIHQHDGNFISSNHKHHKWKLHDTPGVGASEDIQEQRLKDLSGVFHQVDVIMWVIQSDTRALRVDQEAILGLTHNGKKIPKSHIILAITQIDRVHPENWDDKNNCPSKEQSEIIPEKVHLAHKRISPYLPVSVEYIAPCSTLKGYGLDHLISILHKPFNSEI